MCEVGSALGLKQGGIVVDPWENDHRDPMLTDRKRYVEAGKCGSGASRASLFAPNWGSERSINGSFLGDFCLGGILL